MARLDPLKITDLPDNTRQMFEYSQHLMGFQANDVLTMARWPALLAALGPVVNLIYGQDGELDPSVKHLAAIIVSSAAGCRYCQAHTAHGAAAAAGLSAEKIAAVWEFETSELFSERERVALRVARGAGQVPNAVTDQEFQDFRQHYSEQAILEFMGLIGLFGFLNRWNDTLATELEKTPFDFATETLPASQWQAGKHASK